jgi:hypothetical protein
MTRRPGQGQGPGGSGGGLASASCRVPPVGEAGLIGWMKVTQVGEVLRGSGVSELPNASHRFTTVLVALALNYKTLVNDYNKNKNKNKNKLSSLVNHCHC